MNDMESDVQSAMIERYDPDGWDGDGCPRCGERSGCAACQLSYVLPEELARRLDRIINRLAGALYGANDSAGNPWSGDPILLEAEQAVSDLNHLGIVRR